MNLPESLEAARALDAADPPPLGAECFERPRDPGGRPLAYLCGHSLGLMPRSARAAVIAELDDWARLGVEGHHASRRPWIDYAEFATEGLCALTGARTHEVVAMNSLTVNLHLLLASFYRPREARRRILIEAGAFSSDRHAVCAQIAWHGLDPAEELVEVAPEGDAATLDPEAIDAAIEREGDRLALVLWPGVQYRTGQVFDCARIARAAHRVGALAGFDHAHAIGNLPLNLPADDADFAVWCSYKYLNAGPGAIGGAFVHERHGLEPRALRLAGWWGHEPATRFLMAPRFTPARGAAGWAVSNPPVLSTAPLLASLELFGRVGLAALRARSIRLTATLADLIGVRCAGSVALLTPDDPARRGCQLSLRFPDPGEARRVHARLRVAGVVGDLREPDVLRLAPVPFYNGYEDLWRCVTALATAVGERR